MFKSVNYFIRRPGDDEFTNVGRNHNLDESLQIDGEIREYLYRYRVEFEEVERDKAQARIAYDLMTRGVGDLKC